MSRPFDWLEAFEEFDDFEEFEDFAETQAMLDEITALPEGPWEPFAGFTTAAYAERMAEAAEHNRKCREPRPAAKRPRKKRTDTHTPRSLA